MVLVVLRCHWLCCTRVEKSLERKKEKEKEKSLGFIVWPGLFQCIHRSRNLLQSLARIIVQTVLLSVFWWTTQCPVLAHMGWLFIPYASGCVLYGTGVSIWGCPVQMHTLQSQTTYSVIFSRAWNQWSSLCVSRETSPQVSSDLTLL